MRRCRRLGATLDAVYPLVAALDGSHCGGVDVAVMFVVARVGSVLTVECEPVYPAVAHVGLADNDGATLSGRPDRGRWWMRVGAVSTVGALETSRLGVGVLCWRR